MIYNDWQLGIFLHTTISKGSSAGSRSTLKKGTHALSLMVPGMTFGKNANKLLNHPQEN